MTAEEFAKINDDIQNLKIQSDGKVAKIVNMTLDAVTERLEEYVEDSDD